MESTEYRPPVQETDPFGFALGKLQEMKNPIANAIGNMSESERGEFNVAMNRINLSWEQLPNFDGEAGANMTAVIQEWRAATDPEIRKSIMQKLSTIL